MLNTGFLQHTPLRTTSLLFFHFDSVPVPLIIQPLLSSPPFLTLQTNFPFPSCNRLSQIGCSSPQGPYCSNLNVALDVLLPWQIANAFSAFLNASSAMKASCSHTRVSFRWPTSLYFPLDEEKSFPALLTWWAVSPSGILSTLNALTKPEHCVCFQLLILFCFSASVVAFTPKDLVHLHATIL